MQRPAGRAGYDTIACDAGFTLIEALVSFVVFAIVAAAGTTALLAGIKGDNDTSDRIASTEIAQQVNDQARAMARSALTATPTSTSATQVGSKTYSVTRTVSYLPAGTPCPGDAIAANDTTPHEIKIDVVVTAPGVGRTVQMDSVLAC